MIPTFELNCFGGPNSGKKLKIMGGTLVSLYKDADGKLHRYELDVRERVLKYKPMI